MWSQSLSHLASCESLSQNGCMSRVEDTKFSWSEAFYAAYELFFPKACASCGITDVGMSWTRGLCGACDLLARKALLYPRKKNLTGGVAVVSAGIYEYEVARMVLAFKNAGRLDTTEYLVTGLRRATHRLLDAQNAKTAPPVIFLIPAPSSRQSSWRRGYVPAEVLAQRLGRSLNRTERSVFRVAPVLSQRGRFSRSSGQKQLGRSARRARIQRSLTLSKNPLDWLNLPRGLAGVSCILVDDVVTTGATLGVAAHLLKTQGARVIGAVTVAEVPRIEKIERAEIG